MKIKSKILKLLSLVLALFLCMSNLATVSAATIYDINEDELLETISLYSSHEKYFDCYPYAVDNDDASLYLRTINYDDAELEITFCDETEQVILETLYTDDYRTTFYWDNLDKDHVYRIYIGNRSDSTAEVKVNIF